MDSRLNKLLDTDRNVHILYSYSNLDAYLQQAVQYILHGMERQEYILFIDNERLYPMIQQELQRVCSKEDLKYLHFVKNFDFYYSSGSYHPPAIVEYFNKTVKTYVEENLPFRSWAHVEWATLKEPLDTVRELEEHIDWAVDALSFPLICAYRQERMPLHLAKILTETHPYLLTDENFRESDDYKKLAKLLPSSSTAD